MLILHSYNFPGFYLEVSEVAAISLGLECFRILIRVSKTSFRFLFHFSNVEFSVVAAITLRLKITISVLRRVVEKKKSRFCFSPPARDSEVPNRPPSSFLYTPVRAPALRVVPC